MREKAAVLLEEWARTIGPEGDCRMSLYSYDKLLCGLVDLQLYAKVAAAKPLLERTMGWAMAMDARGVRHAEWGHPYRMYHDLDAPAIPVW